MIIIKIFSDFCHSETCKKNFENICNAENINFYGINKNIYITDKNDYTHAIILNKAMPVLNISKENVLGLAFEPFEFLNITPEFINYAQKCIGKYFIGNNKNLPEPFIEHLGYMWHSNPCKEIIYKPNIMSIIVSQKKSAPGHKYRHQLVEKIIKLNLPIDIYGNGSNLYKYSNVKGKFNDAEPYENYMFSICIENYINNHYVSEKIITPIMFNCMPIYWGCNNINQYFNEVITLSGNINNDIQIIMSILDNPSKYYKKTYTEKNKKTVNLIENISDIFTESAIS
jgi:hypothetical protein